MIMISVIGFIWRWLVITRVFFRLWKKSFSNCMMLKNILLASHWGIRGEGRRLPNFAFSLTLGNLFDIVSIVKHCSQSVECVLCLLIISSATVSEFTHSVLVLRLSWKWQGCKIVYYFWILHLIGRSDEHRIKTVLNRVLTQW